MRNRQKKKKKSKQNKQTSKNCTEKFKPNIIVALSCEMEIIFKKCGFTPFFLWFFVLFLTEGPCYGSTFYSNYKGERHLKPLWGYSVWKTLCGLATNMGSKISLLVHEWLLIRCKIWYMNESIFKIWPKIGLIGIWMGCFFLKKLVFVWV